jgi:hypothetical protein
MFQQAFFNHIVGAGDGSRADALPAAPSRRLIGWLGSWVVHPFLLALYPILALFGQNAREVRVGELGALVGWTVVGSMAAWLVLTLLLKNGRQAGLVVCLGVILFFTVDGAIAIVASTLTYLETLWVPGRRVSVNPLWVVIPEALLLGWFAWRVVPRFQDLRGVTAFLNLFAIALIALPAAQVVNAKAPAVGRPPYKPTPFALGSPPSRSG